MRLSRKQQGRKPPEVRILPTPRTPHGNRSHEGSIEAWPVCPTLKHRHGWWAVRQRRSPAKTVGAEVPGEFDSRTIRQPICSDRPRDRAWNPAGRKRVGSAWRNAVGHTCPMRSRTFLLGVTAAHGSLEPLVLVRIQEEELGGSTSNRFSLYTRFDVCCTGYRGFRRHPSRETMPRPCSSVDRASASGAEGHESDSR